MLAADNPTVAFAQKLKDPSKWVTVRAVPSFDEHTESYEEPVLDEKGKPVIDTRTGKPQVVVKTEVFDKARLERHAANNNALVESGNPPGIVIGHTLDKGPETSQPPTAGWAVNHRVGWHPTLNRHVIFHDELYDPRDFEKYDVKSFPYRSVERWKTGEYFKPIAALRREPRRNLGVVAYAAHRDFAISRNGVVRYQRTDDLAIRYFNQELYMSSPSQSMPPAAPAAPAAPAPSMEPSDQDKEIFAKLCAHYGVQYAKPTAGPPVPPTPPITPAPPTAMPTANKEPPAIPPAVAHHPEQNAAGCPSGTNPMIPHQAQTGDVERYAAEVAELRRQVSDLQLRTANAEKDARLERYAAALGDLRRDFQFNMEEELTEVQDFTPEQFAARTKKIKDCYQKLPRDVGRGRGPIAGYADEPPMGDQPERFSREDMEACLRYQFEHPGCTPSEARTKIKEHAKGMPPVAANGVVR